MKTKVILENGSDVWDSKKRYKVNQSVLFNGVSYQNTTGANSTPDLLVDWILVDVNSSKNLQQTLNNGSDATFVGVANPDATLNIDLAFNTVDGMQSIQIITTPNSQATIGITEGVVYNRVDLETTIEEDNIVVSTEKGTSIIGDFNLADNSFQPHSGINKTRNGIESTYEIRQPLPPTDVATNVIIELPVKQSGTYRVATLDDVSNKSQVLNKTTTEINAIASPVEGEQYYNTTLHTICFFNRTTWQRVTSINM